MLDVTAIADTIGFAVMAAVFGLLLFVFWPIAGIPPLLFVFVFLALAVSGMFIWHHGSSPASPITWIWLAFASVAGGAVFFAIDVLIGYFNYPHLPLLEVGSKAGGFFGFLATLAICPGATIVCVASWVRSVFTQSMGTRLTLGGTDGP